MFKVNEYVVYKRDVCKIIDKKVYNDKEYYVLRPIDDDSLKIQVPTSNDGIRRVISKQEMDAVIKEIPKVEPLDIDDKLLDIEYKNLLYSDNLLDLVKIIKTTYERNQFRINNKRKTRDKDVYYFEKAEQYFYNELSVVLNKSFTDTKNYIIELLKGNC